MEKLLFRTNLIFFFLCPLLYVSHNLVFGFWFIRIFGIQKRILISSIDQMHKTINVLGLGTMAIFFFGGGVWHPNQKLHIIVLCTCLDLLLPNSLAVVYVLNIEALLLSVSMCLLKLLKGDLYIYMLQSLPWQITLLQNQRRVIQIYYNSVFYENKLFSFKMYNKHFGNK